MATRTRIGIDIGSTLTKIARDDGFGGTEHASEPSSKHDGPYTEKDAARQLMAIASSGGGVSIGVTGVGASTFLKVARLLPHVTVAAYEEGDALQREATLQARGARHLLLQKWREPKGAHMVVAIGTGISFAPVDEHGKVRIFPIGGFMGGGFLVGQNGGDVESLQNAPIDEMHGDLLLKERLPELDGTPQGEFVLAGYGNMHLPGRSKRMTDAKNSATYIVDKLICMQVFMPDWAWSGPVVFVGSAIEEFPQLRHCLQTYSAMLGWDCRIPEHAGYAGATGAWMLASGILQP